MTTYFITFIFEGYSTIYNEVKEIQAIKNKADLEALEEVLRLEYFMEEDGELTITNLQKI